MYYFFIVHGTVAYLTVAYVCTSFGWHYCTEATTTIDDLMVESSGAFGS